MTESRYLMYFVLLFLPLTQSGCLEKGIYTYDSPDIHAELRECTEAIQRNPSDAGAHLRRGSIYLSLFRYDRAAADFTETLRLGPASHDIYTMRARAYKGLGKCEEARQDYGKAILLRPFDEMAYYDRADVFAELGQYDRAIRDYTRAIQLKLRDDRVYYARGRAYERLGKYRMALEDYDQAAELNHICRSIITSDDSHPLDDHRCHCAEVFYRRGRASQKLGDFGRAIEDYEMAVDIRPCGYGPHNTLTWLLLTCPDPTHRNVSKAIEIAQEATEIEYNSTTLFTLAAAYAEAGMFGNAIRVQEKAIAALKQEDRTEGLAKFLERLEAYRSGQPVRDQ